MTWVGVRSADVWRFEEYLRENLAKLTLHDITPGQILYHLREQNLQLWLWSVGDGLLITEIVHYPNSSVLVLKWGVGKFRREWIKSGREVVVPWAKSYGCTKVEVAGRGGWSRLMGMKPLVTVYRGEI